LSTAPLREILMRAIAQENVENLREFLETWSEVTFTLEQAQQGEAMDMSLLDPGVTYEDTTLPDHIGETYRGHEGVIRAAPQPR
jgi:hypothetical protein